jgi:phosphatidylinositol alpha-1,6-mannosyltransferase
MTAMPAGLRVLALVPDTFGGAGGIAEYNRHFLSSLAACDCVSEVVIAPRWGATAESLPNRVRQLNPRRGRFAYSLSVCRSIFAVRGFDLVVCGHGYMAPLAALLARLLRAKLWVELHGVEAWHPASWSQRRAMLGATMLTAVSRHTRRRVLAWLPIDPQKVRVLPNTVDSRFTPGPKPRYLIERHHLHGRKVLLTVSRLVAAERYKGHDRVIHALPHVLLRHPNAVYIIAGDGDDRIRLEALVEAVGVGSAVRFVGQVAAPELLDYYRLCDLFVMPSTGEGFGIVFLEASASGAPVIGGNRDGSVDALAEGQIGTLVDPDDSSGLIDAIVGALDREQQQSVRRVEDRRFALENFTGHVHDLVRSLN